jgi:hypothetical protein
VVHVRYVLALLCCWSCGHHGPLWLGPTGPWISAAQIAAPPIDCVALSLIEKGGKGHIPVVREGKPKAASKWRPAFRSTVYENTYSQ